MTTEPSTPGRHGALVARLVADARPVSPLPAPAVRTVRWLAVGVGVLALASIRGLRPGVTMVLTSPAHVAELATLVVAVVLLAWLALSEALPAGAPGRLAYAAALAAVVGGAGLELVHRPPDLAEPLVQFIGLGIRCTAETIAIGLVPCVALLAALARSAPLAPARTAALGAMAAFVLAYASMRLICGNDGALHVGIFHGGAVLLGTALATFLGAHWLGGWLRSGLRSS